MNGLNSAITVPLKACHRSRGPRLARAAAPSFTTSGPESQTPPGAAASRGPDALGQPPRPDPVPGPCAPSPVITNGENEDHGR